MYVNIKKVGSAALLKLVYDSPQHYAPKEDDKYPQDKYGYGCNVIQMFGDAFKDGKEGRNDIYVASKAQHEKIQAGCPVCGEKIGKGSVIKVRKEEDKVIQIYHMVDNKDHLLPDPAKSSPPGSEIENLPTEENKERVVNQQPQREVKTWGGRYRQCAAVLIEYASAVSLKKVGITINPDDRERQTSMLIQMQYANLSIDQVLQEIKDNIAYLRENGVNTDDISGNIQEEVHEDMVMCDICGKDVQSSLLDETNTCPVCRKALADEERINAEAQNMIEPPEEVTGELPF